MTYAVPASKASIKQNRFEFSIPGSRKKHSLPKMAYVPLGISATAFADETKPAPGEIIALFKNLGAGDEILTLDAEQAFALMAAWGEASGISLGESSASDDA